MPGGNGGAGTHIQGSYGVACGVLRGYGFLRWGCRVVFASGCSQGGWEPGIVTCHSLPSPQPRWQPFLIWCCHHCCCPLSAARSTCCPPKKKHTLSPPNTHTALLLPCLSTLPPRGSAGCLPCVWNGTADAAGPWCYEQLFQHLFRPASLLLEGLPGQQPEQCAAAGVCAAHIPVCTPQHQGQVGVTPCHR